MHAWEAIQKSLDFIEKNINEDFDIEQLAKESALSPFYFQRLFSRLVKKPVREYIKLCFLRFLILLHILPTELTKFFLHYII